MQLQNLAYPDGIYTVTRITKDIYHIFEAAGVHSTLIVGTKKALLFDTGYGLGDLKKTVESITTLPLIIVNSHGHFDHVSGNYHFERAFIHKNDIDLNNDRILYTKRLKFIKETMLPKDILIPDDFEAFYPPTKKKVHFDYINEGDTFDLGGICLEVIYLPGHTMGCIALYDRERKILFGGDTISEHIWMFLPECAHMSTLVASLHKIEKYDIDEIIASHFPIPYKKEIIYRILNCIDSIDISKSRYYEPRLYVDTSMALDYTHSNGVTMVFDKDKL